MKYRINYTKGGRLIYISHLDMQRMFQRIFRRADLDLMFSQGFNPHTLMSYTPPLPLYASSEDEYVDVQLSGSESEEEVFEKIKPQCPDGLIIKSVKKLPEGGVALSKLFQYAQYEIIFECKTKIDADSVNAFFKNSDSVNTQKMNKKKQWKTIDIKPMVSEFHAENSGKFLKIDCTLNFNNDSVLNPFTLIKALSENIENFDNAKLFSLHKKRVI